MNEKMITILPGMTLNLSSENNGPWCVDKVFCDSPLCSFSAQASGTDIGLADRSSAVDGVYAALDSAAKIASTGLVKGPFQKIYVATTSDSIRVHICRLIDADVDHRRFV